MTRQFLDPAGTPAADQHWMRDGLCRELGSELFFVDKGKSLNEAKAICARCPVRAQCLEYSLDRKEPFGVWGGVGEGERRELLRKRRVLKQREAS